jgi:hypothetical protein
VISRTIRQERRGLRSPPTSHACQGKPSRLYSFALAGLLRARAITGPVHVSSTPLPSAIPARPCERWRHRTDVHHHSARNSVSSYFCKKWMAKRGGFSLRTSVFVWSQGAILKKPENRSTSPKFPYCLAIQATVSGPGSERRRCSLSGGCTRPSGVAQRGA